MGWGQLVSIDNSGVEHKNNEFGWAGALDKRRCYVSKYSHVSGSSVR